MLSASITYIVASKTKYDGLRTVSWCKREADGMWITNCISMRKSSWPAVMNAVMHHFLVSWLRGGRKQWSSVSTYFLPHTWRHIHSAVYTTHAYTRPTAIAGNVVSRCTGNNNTTQCIRSKKYSTYIHMTYIHNRKKGFIRTIDIYI